MLNTKIDRYEKLFRSLLKNDSVRRYEKELQESVDGMGWWKRNVFSRKKRKQIDTEVGSIRAIRDDKLDMMRLNIARWSEEMKLERDNGHEHSVVYFREHQGKGELKAYYTNDWQFQYQPEIGTLGARLRELSERRQT